MNALLAVLMVWLSFNFDLPAAQQPPDVKFATREQMAELRYGTRTSGYELVALYDDRTGAILLSDGWTGRTPAELSVLVHELVHHLQNVGKQTYICPGAREALAYAAQDKWLGLFGESLHSAFEIDPLTLKMRTACM